MEQLKNFEVYTSPNAIRVDRLWNSSTGPDYLLAHPTKDGGWEVDFAGDMEGKQTFATKYNAIAAMIESIEIRS